MRPARSVQGVALAHRRCQSVGWSEVVGDAMDSLQDVGGYPEPRRNQSDASARTAHTARVALGSRPAPKRVRRTSLALALSRLEREHVALLLAICELETPRAVDPNAAALREALLPLLREDLRQTQHALARAARGSYGVCEACHKPISARQLELHPAATCCATCRSPQERDRRISRALKD